ncbi:MAG: hypothetical protein HN976_20390 [Lentisphaerae bacterium]|nr:hypothetical protein [Lentisphaerota bacterium]
MMKDLHLKLFYAALITGVMTASTWGASVELWPSERRTNNTLFCYGSDWNVLLIAISSDDHGKHRLELPERFSEPTVLQVTIPKSVDFLGAHVYGQNELGVNRAFETTPTTRNGEAFQNVRIPLLNDILTQRLISNSYYYRVHVWIDAPERLDSTVSWELQYGKTTLAKGGSKLVTAGVVRPDRKLPRTFGFYPYGCLSIVPRDDHDRMAEFYRRFGISGIEAHWPYGLPGEKNKRLHSMFEANRRHGVKNNANMTLFARKYGKRAYGGRRDATLKLGGLTKAMDQVCAGLTSDAAREDWRQAQHVFDLAHWDWEPTGPDMWPGYDDEATIAAFATENRINRPLKTEDLRTTHRDAYRQFRMRQIARPLYAMKKAIDSVRPIPFRVEQGSGASRHVDYGIYGNDFDALSPMIYQPSPLGYARNLLETLKSTSVPARKFWPDLTIGWSFSKVHRESPEAFLMDTIVTAAAGCGSVSHWPGIHLVDASWFGIHEGLARIALVEEFYTDGAKTDTVTMKGVPYRHERIDLGHTTIDHVAPDWRSSLICFAHERQDETLLSLLNYHLAEDAFVAVAAPALRSGYLVNPVEKTYQALDDSGKAIVQVHKQTPELWIATANPARVNGLRRIETATVTDRLTEAKSAFLKANKAGAVRLGKVDGIDVTYGLVTFGGENRTVLKVVTAEQTIAFGASGGRIYDWSVKGVGEFVAKKTFGTDGFAMDMLWLPETARWSSDEVQEMGLVRCDNDGQEARIVYEMSLSNGFPGIRLRKTYRVSVQSTSVTAEIDLFNERVDQTPATLAYWGHNVLSVARTTFVGDEMLHETGKGLTTIFPVRGLPEKLKPHVLMHDRIVGETGTTYAEFIPELQAGLVFSLPPDLMNIYRWSARTKTMCGSEWMPQPFSIPAGTTRSLAFSVTAVAGATPESLRERVLAKDAGTPRARNLLACRFEELDDNGLPAQYKITKKGPHAEQTVVSTEKDDSGHVVVKAEILREASVHIDSAKRTRLDPDADYFLTVQVRVDDMRYTGNWYKRPAGIRIYAYGLNDKHTWLAIHGEGNTDGWVTGVLPFPHAEDVRQQLAVPNVLLRCYNMTGTVRFREPMILKKPQGVQIQRAFEQGDGTQVFGGQLQLRR